MKQPIDKYLTSNYLKNKPSWDIEDSPWKAEFVTSMLASIEYIPNSICDIGCGAGGVLASLRRLYPLASLFGFDIAPDVTKFWQKHSDLNITFQVGDFLALNSRKYDVLLLLDVVEHLSDPFSFLNGIQGFSTYYLFHFPLDLSAMNVFLEKPILLAREKAGHVHYFTKNLSLLLLDECGFDVIDWRYSGAAFNAPIRTLKTLIGSIPRKLAYMISKDFGVRAFGGETLFVLAMDKTNPG